MKKTLIALVLATFFLSMPLASEARPGGEAQPTSLNTSLNEYHQSSGVGRIRSRRRQVRRRRRVRRQTRRHVRRHNRAVRRRVRARSGHDH